MLNRRMFNFSMGAGLASTALAGPAMAQPAYNGPNVIVIRFGGGVRRAETIQQSSSYAPYLVNDLMPRGVLIPDLQISQLEGGNTSHAEGTLNLLTGRYEAYRDAGSAIGDRLEPTEPTLFEYFREAFNVPSHQVLLINGEDRPQEEYLTYGVNGHYGINFKSEMLSLHRFKLYKLAQQLAETNDADANYPELLKEFEQLQTTDYRGNGVNQPPEIVDFWSRWRTYYGDDGFKNPRGDRLLTELSLWAMRDLQPRLMMVNYQDPDYVHWGNASHYTRAISIIDDGIRQLVQFADTHEHYRGNTVFVITPDCGRDSNDLMAVPFQHHFNTRAAHDVWALVMGPGIARGRIMDRAADQVSIAPTIAAMMGVAAENAEGDILSGLST